LSREGSSGDSGSDDAGGKSSSIEGPGHSHWLEVRFAEPSVHGGAEPFGSGEAPRVEDVAGEFVIVDLIEFDADPTADANVRWSEESVGRVTDEGLLGAWSDGKPDGDVSVVMMVVGEHGEDLVVYEEGWFTVGEFLGGGGESGADFANAAQVFAVVVLLALDFHSTPRGAAVFWMQICGFASTPPSLIFLVQRFQNK